MRTYSGSSIVVFRYMFMRSYPAHFALGVDNVLLISILAVERSAVGVLTSYSAVIFLPPIVIGIRWGSGFFGRKSAIIRTCALVLCAGTLRLWITNIVFVSLTSM